MAEIASQWKVGKLTFKYKIVKLAFLEKHTYLREMFYENLICRYQRGKECFFQYRSFVFS